MRYTLFKTNTGNWYFFSFYMRQIVPCHPILKYILDNETSYADIVRELSSIQKITIDNCVYDNDSIRYYSEKYKYLCENHFFDDVNATTAFNNRKINKQIIDKQLQNCYVICFEMTENCNLRCKYCVYGDNYSFHSERAYFDMPFTIAKTVIDFFVDLWKTDKNIAYQNKYIAFYGGEPLLRINQIKDIVSYFNKRTSELGVQTGFLITTNGVLLNKYADFLVDNNFSIMVSLDGDEISDQYRVFPDGKYSYEIVTKNIQAIRDKYPMFYNSNVSFSVVLHDKNNEPSVINFFERVYDKTPIISNLRLTDTNCMECHQCQYHETPNYTDENFDMTSFLKTSEAQTFLKFIKYYGRTVFEDYGIYGYNSIDKMPLHPTGVCLPFAKKCFVTAQGKILPCERINFKYSLGSIENNHIFLNSTQIAAVYNKYFDDCKEICSKCFNFFKCDSCLFNDILHDDQYGCPSFMDQHIHSRYLSQIWSVFESNPQVYQEVKNQLNYE